LLKLGENSIVANGMLTPPDSVSAKRGILTPIIRKARDLFTGNRDAAIAKEHSLITYGKDISNPRALVQRAHKRAQNGDIEGATHDFDEAVRHSPTKAITYFNRGCFYHTVGRLVDAIADFSAVIERLPNYDEAYYQRANSWFKLGHWQSAIEDYSQAIKINPFCIKAYYKRAESRSELGDSQGALSDYTQAILRVPNDANAYYQRGLYHSKTSQLHPAVADFTTAIERNPRHADAYFNRGYCLTQLGETERATQDFSQALLHAPSRQELYYSRAYALGMLQGPPAILPEGSSSWNGAHKGTPHEVHTVTVPLEVIHPAGSEEDGDVQAEIDDEPLPPVQQKETGSSPPIADDLLKPLELHDPRQADLLKAEQYYSQGVACANQGDKQGSLTALAEASGLFLRHQQMVQYQEVMALMRSVSKDI
jgi:tetratricopeptide (TPR) repeat protein